MLKEVQQIIDAIVEHVVECVRCVPSGNDYNVELKGLSYGTLENLLWRFKALDIYPAEGL